MTKKHFEAIAKIIKEEKEASSNEDADVMANAIALRLSQYFITENHHFDPYRFLRACGIRPEALQSTRHLD